MRIGEVAVKAGSVQAVRYYERRGSQLDDTLQQVKSMRGALLAVAAWRCDGNCPIVDKALATPATTNVRRSLRRPQ
jgi:hypothetical protein